MPGKPCFCTFFLNGLWFGVDVEAVREVLRPHAITRVPLAPDAVAGLINLRGEIVTVIDLRRRLGLPPREASAPAMHVVLESDGEAISLLVDEAGEIVRAGQDSYEEAPESLSTEARQLVPGIHRLREGLLHVLALDVVCGGNTKETAKVARRGRR
ncbi:MAG: chemotaxis protein CheW [Candidatus Korobacteraceae bacterium]